ncbi:prenyltransferase/squalene oxidase repeat-containing protein [Streptomyces vinaceus]|uniref:prenyltransferase/squalene oxidase repeat-containing protein n=1 Tax=Streptomyces vinaceus TaxID=1960 RepID=UPI0036CBC62C
MDQPDSTAVARLRTLTQALGSGGGQISPAVYDTARALALSSTDTPTRQHRLQWLIAQQQPDGGWGSPHIPRARDLPTLAAVLALHDHPSAQASYRKGLDFLHEHARCHWAAPLPQDLPVGLELTLPALLREAARQGIRLPDVYAPLHTLGKIRRRIIGARSPQGPGTPAVHCWETWAAPGDASLVDGSGGIGHSPAATIAWLHFNRATTPWPLVEGAERYLKGAQAATHARRPLLPTVWPITHFERVWCLHALALSRLTDHPQLKDVCDWQLDRIAEALSPTGLGMSDHFMVDGDVTATALATLALTGRPADSAILERFRTHDHYGTYPGELQSSVTTTAHAVHALAVTGTAPESLSAEPVDYLLSRQDDNGRWAGDKWHSSWIYTTAQTLTALLNHPPARRAALRAVQALISSQNPDGSWGTRAIPSAGETGYATLALHVTHTTGPPFPEITEALHRATTWLRAWHQDGASCGCGLWIGKDLYCPTRLDAAVALTALTAETDINMPGPVQ